METDANHTIDDLLKWLAGATCLRPKLGGHVVIESECCSHIMMLS